MNAPEISVIVPVYNVEKYLCRCVDSILNQTFTDFELILVDDGSPDNCGAICDEYAAKDSRIRVIHKTNGGLSSARNAGLDIAQGRYVMFCDSDDYVAANWCEVMLGVLAKNIDSFVVSNIWKVYADRKTSYQPIKNDTELHSYFEIYKFGISAYVWNKIYRADILRKYNLRFDESCRFAEDVGFNARYCALCDKCVYIPIPLYYYADTQDSIMNRYYPDYFELHLPLFQCRIPLISDADLAEYCDIWLYHFLNLFDNVFDCRNQWSFFKKLQYNQRMLQSKEFRFCLEHATGKNENPLAIKILRTHNYYLFWLFDQLVKLKGKLRRK